ncbi:MAG: DsbA family protein [Roseiflexaceae bacterium]|nr:DsbA family protein [Roseiflexaceae bacterium]
MRPLSQTPTVGRGTMLLVALALTACGAGQAAAPSAPTADTATITTAVPTVASAATAPAAASAATVDRGEGDPNAPVKVIEYSDFQCPYCAVFVRETLPQLKAEYIDTGKVYFEYRDFPITEIHGSAVLAAHAANCAAVQGNFFPMHDRLFQGQEAGEWGENLSEDFAVFLGYARELNIDAQALQDCVQGQQFAPQIAQDYQEALAAGVESTPHFLVNGAPLIGAQPFEVWQRTLDAALEESGQ